MTAAMHTSATPAASVAFRLMPAKSCCFARGAAASGVSSCLGLSGLRFKVCLKYVRSLVTHVQGHNHPANLIICMLDPHDISTFMWLGSCNAGKAQLIMHLPSIPKLSKSFKEGKTYPSV